MIYSYKLNAWKVQGQIQMSDLLLCDSSIIIHDNNDNDDDLFKWTICYNIKQNKRQNKQQQRLIINKNNNNNNNKRVNKNTKRYLIHTFKIIQALK